MCIRDRDSSAVCSIEDVQELLETDTYQVLYVVPYDVADVESIAEDIENMDETLDAQASKDLARRAGEVVGNIRLMTFSVGAIAAIIGGLGVLNTMIMSVMERRREIGILKAIGATNRRILSQFLMEAFVMSLIGGIAGIALGFVGTAMINALVTEPIAVITPSLILIGISFAVFLGIAGGLYPSMKAAKLDPVVALRYE